MTPRPHPVTDHAVVRYFERVHSIDFAAVFPDATHDGERVAQLSSYLDIPVSDLRDLVCPPRIQAGLLLGATLVRSDRYRMVCAGGRVVTVLPPVIKSKRRRRPACLEFAA